MKGGKMILLSIISVIVIVLIIFQIKSMSAVVLIHSVEINTPKEKVWQILNQLEMVANYNPQVERAKYITDIKNGVGASRECKMHDGYLVKERITKVETDAITMELYESSWPVKDMRWRTQLSENNGKTIMKQKLEYKVKHGALGAVLNTLVMKGKMNNAIQETFEGLKSYAEKD